MARNTPFCFRGSFSRGSTAAAASRFTMIPRKTDSSMGAASTRLARFRLVTSPRIHRQGTAIDIIYLLRKSFSGGPIQPL